jgi:hypothetical protein
VTTFAPAMIPSGATVSLMDCIVRPPYSYGAKLWPIIERWSATARSWLSRHSKRIVARQTKRREAAGGHWLTE